MLVQAIFVAICFSGVLFLLRFLFALESEIRAERMRSKATVEHVTAFPTPSGFREAASLLTVAHSRPWQPIHSAMDAAAKFSQLRRA
jgi:hypothetical protein